MIYYNIERVLELLKLLENDSGISIEQIAVMPVKTIEKLDATMGEKEIKQI